MSNKKLVGVYDKKKGSGRLGKLSYITVPKQFTEKDILDNKPTKLAFRHNEGTTLIDFDDILF